MIRSCIAILAIALAGCDHLPKRYDVPVPVACIKPESIPKRPPLVTDGELRSASRGERVIAMRNYQDQAGPYIAALEGIAGACSAIK